MLKRTTAVKKTKKLIIANWKMNPLLAKDAEKLFSGVAKNIPSLKNTEVVICPPGLYIERLKKLSKKLGLGAQDSFYGDTGAFTGQISSEMLRNTGVKYVILGHSERRSLGEDNILINKKIKSVISSGMVPVLCVGETVREIDHAYFNVVKEQVEVCLNGISKNLISKVIIAYEPVWALSTTIDRKDATPTDLQEMVIFIRKVLADKFGVGVDMPRIIYGGSVNDRDAGEFLDKGEVTGLLVGKASLDVKKFSEIIKICETSNK